MTNLAETSLGLLTFKFELIKLLYVSGIGHIRRLGTWRRQGGIFVHCIFKHKFISEKREMEMEFIQKKLIMSSSQISELFVKKFREN